MKRERLAVLLTAYNRKRDTLNCIEHIRSQELGDYVQVHVILVDDGCTDGTAPAVRDRFPEVELIAGSGRLYWNGGMHLAFERALCEDYDFYLLMNDDTHLDSGAVEKMLRTYQEVAERDRPESIVIGSTRDPRTGRLTYGGWRSVGRLRPTKCVRAEPSDAPQACDTMNGNCVLIPRAVARRVGNLDARFTHGIGDWDYGFRAKRARCALWLAPGYIGTCAANSLSSAWLERSLGIAERWRRLVGPKGLPPREWLVFIRRHGGLLWPLVWLSPYVRFWFGALVARLRRSR